MTITDPFRVPVFQKILSFLWPVTIHKICGRQTASLELLLWRNQFQLASPTAIYSDGRRYRPFRKAFRKIGIAKLRERNSCLILGSALGSIVQMLALDYHFRGRFVLVEQEKQVLDWSLLLLARLGIDQVEPVCDDAWNYMRASRARHDLICVDLFLDREVPGLFLTPEFLVLCDRMLAEGGIWIMNYIILEEHSWRAFHAAVLEVFPTARCVHQGINVMIIYEKREAFW